MALHPKGPKAVTRISFASDDGPIRKSSVDKRAKGSTSADTPIFTDVDIDSLSEFEAKLLRLVAEMFSRLDSIANTQVQFQERLELQLHDLGTTTRETSSATAKGSSRDADTRQDTTCAKKGVSTVSDVCPKKVVFARCTTAESLVAPLEASVFQNRNGSSPKQTFNPSANFLTWSSPSWSEFGEEAPPAAPKIILKGDSAVYDSLDAALSNGTHESGDKAEHYESGVFPSDNIEVDKQSSLTSNDSMQDGVGMAYSLHDWMSTGSADGRLQKAARRMADLFHRRGRSARETEFDFQIRRGKSDCSLSTSSLDKNEYCTSLDRYVLSPESSFRTVFDIGSFFVLLYDAVSIPVILAWDPKDSQGVLRIGMLLSAMFWSSDLFLNFFTGYYVQGKLVLRMNRIATRYVKGFFFMDFLLCFFDWFGLVMENVGTDSGTLGVLRVTKVHRLVRIVGVFRMSKVWTRIERINPYYFFEGFQIASEVAQLVSLIVWINHLFCCMWYFLAVKVPPDTGVTWLDIIEESSVGSITYMDQSMMYQYTTAYHWALTQMTPGSMQVFPQNSAERLLNILCLVVGLVFGTSLTSRLSAKMVQLQMSRQEQVMKLMKLRRYLKEHSVNANLASRIQRHVQQHVTTKKPLFESQVTVLSLLTPTLRQDLRYDLFQPHLLQCPFLRVCDKIDTTAMHSLCTIMAVIGLEPGSEGQLFGAFEKVTTTWIVVLGEFRYLADESRFSRTFETVDTGAESNSTMNTVKTINTFSTVKTVSCSTRASNLSRSSSMATMEPRKLEVSVEPGRWLCEFALWLDWTTRGAAEAAEPCEVLAIDASRILSALKRHLVVQNLYRGFCQAYAEVCDLDDDGSLDDALDDLGRGLLDSGQGEVITCMPIESREIVAQPILEDLRDRAWFHTSDKMVKAYENEVKSGKSAIFLDRNGNPERLALVVSVYVSRASDAYVLVKLGRVKHNEVVSSFHLPYSRLRHVEKPAEAAHRILASEIGPLVPEPIFEKATRTIDSKSTYNITTKYIRTTFYVNAEGEEDFEYTSAVPEYPRNGRSSIDSVLSVVVIPLGEKQEGFQRRSISSNFFRGSSLIGNSSGVNPPLIVRQSHERKRMTRLTMRMSRQKSQRSGTSSVQNFLPVERIPTKVYFVRDPSGRDPDELQGHIYAWLHPDDVKDLEEISTRDAHASAHDLLSRMDQTLLRSVLRSGQP